MNFFERQDRSRRTSRYLVIAFAVAFGVCALATTALAAFVLRLYVEPVTQLERASLLDWVAASAGPLGLIFSVTLGVMGLASLYRASSLSGGGAKVARLLGGTEVSADATDLPRRRLMNVVEEMAIASGVPMPDVFVLENEAGINAFAAGTSPSNAAVAVTRGALERLDRAELQGVIAHEFSHIVNGDVRLNTQLIGFSFGILLLTLLGRILLRSAHFGAWSRRRRGGGAPVALALGLGFIVIGSIGVLASRLIKAAVSRERERLADASAVQFTRDPSGLAAALKKIGGFTSHLKSVEREEVSHMLFEHGAASFRGLFATHPPLVERIRELEPDFDPAEFAAGQQVPPEAQGNGGAAPFASLHGGAQAQAPLDRAGEIASPSVGFALREALPAEIIDAAHSRETSWLLVLALALSPDEPVRGEQVALLEAQIGARRAQRTAALRAELDALEPRLRLPVFELAVPAVRQRPQEQLVYLFELVQRVARLTQEPRLFDFVLVKMLAAHIEGLDDASLATDPEPMRSDRAACTALLAAVAAYGHDNDAQARAAFAAGAEALRATLEPPPGTPDEWRDLARVDAALTRLRRLRPQGKRHALAAVLATIRHDRQIGVEEHELFRAVAAVLEIPVPPAF